MPQDSVIEVVVKARDEITGSLGRIEGSLQKTTNNLIAVGNAAASVDNIFSSLTSIQLRLENATERLANAQDRLTDAQKGLIDIQNKGDDSAIKLERAQIQLEKATAKLRVTTMKYGGSSIEAKEASVDLKEAQFDLSEAQKSGQKRANELQKAQDEVERATRSLTIAQNNLARTQNQVIGTYINAGVQALTLVNSMSQLIKTTQIAQSANIALMGSFGPLGIAIAAAGFLLGTTLLNSLKKVDDQMNELIQTESFYSSADMTINTKNAIISRTIEWDEYNKTLRAVVVTLDDVIRKEQEAQKHLGKIGGPTQRMTRQDIGTIKTGGTLIDVNEALRQMNKTFQTKR